MLNVLRWIILLCCLGGIGGVQADQVSRTGAMWVPDNAGPLAQATSPVTNGRPLWHAVWQAHPSEIALTVLILFALGLSLAIYLWRNNRLLRDLTRINREAQSSFFVHFVAVAAPESIARARRR